ncbi:MAG: hypothetical protein MOGMAGMI_00163 [Candidatus Omnitrophica bacterium]|nr:hypothetical protein [Candidatus Omnitrophota bacterium]
MLAIALTSAAPLSAAPERAPQWREYGPAVFEEARRDGKLVLLNVGAVWCHWCHVMDEKTYADERILDVLERHYVTTRVDQDARPDLSLRYERWGWPATVILTADGSELVKRKGYVPPEVMLSLLEAVVADPTPGPSVVPEPPVVPGATALSAEQRRYLMDQHDLFYDTDNGGWGRRLKLIDADSLEWAVARGRSGEIEQEKRARRTLDQALYLEDPVWGGFYQYSDESDWRSPHYEKIVQIQAVNMRAYAQAAVLYGEERYLRAARRTAVYMTTHLGGPGGTFFVSQNADAGPGLSGREFYAKGAFARWISPLKPAVDRHVYARENGWMISALSQLHQASGERRWLDRALSAAEWVVLNRADDQGGYRHDETDPAGPYLGDTLAMGQAFLDLYVSTADRRWLELSVRAAGRIEKSFKDPETGYISAVISAGLTGEVSRPVRHPGENIQLARWANLLSRYTGQTEHRVMTEHAMRYLSSEAVINGYALLPGILLADAELGSDPLHVTVVGSRSDARTRQLYAEALALPGAYRRIELWDRAEGPLPHADVEYPELERPAAYLCDSGACSAPITEPGRLKGRLLPAERT